MEAATATKTTTWSIDLAHSEILFKVKHLMITNVKGVFRQFKADINGNDFISSKIYVTLDPTSVFTNDESRDNHLKSADFFDTDNYKSITFESTSFKKVEGENYLLKGMLTIKNISKEITLDVEFGGISKDPWGNEKAGFSVNGKINRKDWGLNWNATLETGGLLVSEEVKISADVQFIKQS